MTHIVRKYVTSNPIEATFSEDAALISIPQSSESAMVKSDDIFSDISASGGWLPRLQLMSSNSKPCKDGTFPVNHYALVQGQQFTDLSKSVDILVLDWRPKAIDMSGDEIITVYDTADSEFKRIQAKADVKDSRFMFGPEYLVYVPSAKQFALFFMGSASSRREAPALKARMQKAATLGVQMIEGKEFTWANPAITPCSTPMDLPAAEAVMEELTKFNNPAKSDIEKIDSGDQPNTGRAR